MSLWGWYQPAWDILRQHLLDHHQDKWQYNGDELSLFEDEFVYGEFKHEQEHTVSCPWACCDFKIEFTTFVKMEVKE